MQPQIKTTTTLMVPVFIILFSSISFAKQSSIQMRKVSSSTGCEIVPWPFSKNSEDIKQIKIASFEQLPRTHLFSYLYFELSRPQKDRVPHLAHKILFYLRNTETDLDRSYLLQAFQHLANPNEAHPHVIPESELCQLELKLKNKG